MMLTHTKEEKSINNKSMLLICFSFVKLVSILWIGKKNKLI